MNNIDKEKYIEVLLALAGFGNIETEKEEESKNISSPKFVTKSAKP